MERLKCLEAVIEIDLHLLFWILYHVEVRIGLRCGGVGGGPYIDLSGAVSGLIEASAS